MSKNILETLQGMGIQTESALNSSNMADAVPTETLRAEIMELVPAQSYLLPHLPGDQNKALGRSLGKMEKVTVVGEIQEFDGGEAEQTSGINAATDANGELQLAKVVIEQQRFELTFDITEQLKTYSVEDFLAWIKSKAPESVAKTLDSVLLNGDNTAGATGNINSVDAAPAARANYKKVDDRGGIRKLGLANNSKDLGVIDFQDYLDMLGSMGIYGAEATQLLWLFNAETYTKSLGLEEFKDAAKNGKDSVIFKGSKAVTNILGADAVKVRSYRKAKADGKVSVTPANNTKGGASLIWTPAVQHGFGLEFKMKIFDYGSRGMKLNMWFDWGYGIVDPSAVGIDDGEVIATGYNATL